MNSRQIAQLLPRVFQRTLREGGLLQGLLEVMEGLWNPSEASLAHLDAAFDPHRTPEAFVPYLAGWVDLDRLFDERPAGVEEGVASDAPPLSSGMGRLRELVAVAAWLSQWRGTEKGLVRFLETATGIPGFSVDEETSGPKGTARPFHLRVVGPREAAPHEALLHRIIRSEKPAFVTYDLDLTLRR